MNTTITTINSNSLIDPQAQRLVDFLRDVGLPHDNIMADPAERSIIASNLPAYLESLPAEVKRNARFFDAAVGSGLIDHNLKMTMAAIAIADMNVWAHRS